MIQFQKSLTGALLFSGILAIAPSSAFAEENQSLPPEFRVSNGKKAAVCDFPPVAYVGGCTGTLVHPKVVTYAWHCGTSSRTITFSETGSGGLKVPVEKCVRNPRGSADRGDWAYCILKEPIKDIPIVPIVAGCEYEMISKVGQEVVQVGFGETGKSRAGTKYWGVSEVTYVGQGVVRVGDKNGVVACPGDSGGPLMVRMEDKSWRTIGILSTYNGRCGRGGMNTYADAHEALSWMEESSGIDLTPCFDKDGNWEPGPDCGGFYASDPGVPSGSWSDKCEGTPRSGKSTTCGEQEGAEKDEDDDDKDMEEDEDEKDKDDDGKEDEDDEGEKDGDEDETDGEDDDGEDDDDKTDDKKEDNGDDGEDDDDDDKDKDKKDGKGDSDDEESGDDDEESGDEESSGEDNDSSGDNEGDGGGKKKGCSVAASNTPLTSLVGATLFALFGLRRRRI